jgi:hypothetical protein
MHAQIHAYIYTGLHASSNHTTTGFSSTSIPSNNRGSDLHIHLYINIRHVYMHTYMHPILYYTHHAHVHASYPILYTHAHVHAWYL